jgi:hypothetical protein
MTYCLILDFKVLVLVTLNCFFQRFDKSVKQEENFEVGDYKQKTAGKFFCIKIITHFYRTVFLKSYFPHVKFSYI